MFNAEVSTGIHLPALRDMDKGLGYEEGQDPSARVCELAPFLYRGERPWPFLYSIPEIGGNPK